MTIKIGILGYGNIGRGIESAIMQNADMELAAVFTRRDPASVKIYGNAPVVNVDEIEAWQDKIDVMILCGGSATDLPEQTPAFAKLFHVVDSFDTHAKIPQHFANVDASAKEGGKVGIISVGWDPGMFSLNRLYAESVAEGTICYILLAQRHLHEYIEETRELGWMQTYRHASSLKRKTVGILKILAEW